MHTLKVMSAVAIILTCGCNEAYNPFCSRKDAILQPAAIGIWHDDAITNECWVVRRCTTGGGTYAITKGQGGKLHIAGNFFRLHDQLFLDVWPMVDASGSPMEYYSSLVPVHSLFKVVHTNSTVELYRLELDLGRTSAASPAEKFASIAPTEKLQAILSEHVTGGGTSVLYKTCILSDRVPRHKVLAWPY